VNRVAAENGPTRLARSTWARPKVFATLQKQLPFAIIALVTLMGVSAVTGYLISAADQTRLKDYVNNTRDVRAIQQGLVDAETAARGAVLTGDPAYLEAFITGLGSVNQQGTRIIETTDVFDAGLPLARGEAHPLTRRIAELKQVWGEAITLALNHRRDEAANLLQTRDTKRLMDEVRGMIGAYIAYRSQQGDAVWAKLESQRSLIVLINLIGSLLAVGATSYAFLRGARQARGREAAIQSSVRARRQTERLFGMTDLLQSAAGREDANDVLRATARQLMPGFGGALYVFSNSRDRLDLSVAWGDEGQEPAAEHLAPDSCWALKSGKPHRNHGGDGLQCSHVRGGRASLEIPMAARGEILGLLAIHSNRDGDDLAEVSPVAMALADGMSLALANIALRERLRNQALRDPLTGLYNRRFLEEMIDRLTQEAERRKTPLSAVMLDLDHFKMLNDQYGHPMGDLVLQEVARVVASEVRMTDVVCRYGGEEIAVLLPDCSLDMAVHKAEHLRARLQGITLTDMMVSVSGSFGVASLPETCGRGADLLALADAALYQAKRQGRDRVVAAARRPSAETIWLPGHGAPAAGAVAD
jgi:diguanylate cyclase (GGDEF)-like protein